MGTCQSAGRGRTAVMLPAPRLASELAVPSKFYGYNQSTVPQPLALGPLYRAGPKGTCRKRRTTAIVGIYSACAPSARAIAASSRRTPRYDFERLAPTGRRLLSGWTAPSWALSPCTLTAGIMDWMDRSSLRALPGGAANARSGRRYQVLVHGHQPRALDTPIQAF